MRAAPLLLLLLAGAVSAVGFAPLNLWPVTFLALVFLVDRVCRADRLRDAVLGSWVFGVGHFLVGINWIATAFTFQANMPAWYGWASVALLSLYLALFPALAGALAWRISRHREPGFVFVFAATWMLGEWLRAVLLTGFAWNPLGVLWLPLPWVAQGAGWIGTYGLSGLVILVAGLFWLGLQRRWRTTVSLTLVLTALVLLLGRWMNVVQEAPRGAGAIPIRIVQPNISQDEKYDKEQVERHERLYKSLSGKPASTPRVLFWPEDATLRFLELEPKARTDLAALLGPQDLLITGGESASPDKGGAHNIYRNSVFALDSSGALLWRYDKAHLVPFGEYLPARHILERVGLSRLVPGEEDFVPGPGPRTFPLPGFSSAGVAASVGVQICYEIVFSGRVVDEARRPSFLFNPSNDAWFGAWGPPQHLAQAQMRAIEEGIPVIRATPNGISALVSATGRLISTIPPHRAGVIDGFIPERRPLTLFSQWGLWTCALFGLCLFAVGVAFNFKTRVSGYR